MKYLIKIGKLVFGSFIFLRNILFEYIYSTKGISKIAGFEEMSDKGFAIFPDFISKFELKNLRDDFISLQEKKQFDQEGQLSGRLYEHGPISELSKLYIDKFWPIAEIYFDSKKIRCELTMYQKSWPKLNTNDLPGGEFHEDDNKRNLKFFVYLTDVDRESGPFCYVPGTHGLRKLEKFWRWLLWEIFHDRKYLYDYMLDVDMCKKNEIPVIGRAGTYFCCDTTGYHRASMPSKGVREVFVVSYVRA
jgi:hypothetical protein